MRVWLPVVLAAALSACRTETKERGLMGTWQDADPNRGWGGAAAQKGEARREPSPEPPKGKLVEIPRSEEDAMNAFVDRPSTLMADAVEIDLTRNGWLGRMSIAVAPDAVDRRDLQDADAGVLTITLTRRSDAPATKDSVPTVRFGDGLRIVGVDRIVVRYSLVQQADRPFWFHAVGSGRKALYTLDSGEAKEWRGTTVDLRAEMRRQADTYKFDWAAEAMP